MFGSRNRVSDAIASARARLELLEPDKALELDKGMALDGSEHFDFQQAQAQAYASGLLTADEAHMVYVALGEVGNPSNGGWATGTDTATKVTVTRLIAEILNRRILARTA